MSYQWCELSMNPFVSIASSLAALISNCEYVDGHANVKRQRAIAEIKVRIFILFSLLFNCRIPALCDQCRRSSRLVLFVFLDHELLEHGVAYISNNMCRT